MEAFASQLTALTAAGYKLAEAQAKVAHDAILFAMHKSGFKRNCTVKGGVVMVLQGDRRVAVRTGLSFGLHLDFLMFSHYAREARAVRYWRGRFRRRY